MSNKKTAILIPVLLDLGVLLVFPLLIEQFGLAKGLMLSFVAFVAPWVPFAIIPFAVNKEISDKKSEWDEKQKQDFV